MWNFPWASHTLRTFPLCTGYELAEAMTVPNCHHRVVHGEPPDSHSLHALFQLQLLLLLLPQRSAWSTPAQFIPPRVTLNRSQPISTWVTLPGLDPPPKSGAAFALLPWTQIPCSGPSGHGCQGPCHSVTTTPTGNYGWDSFPLIRICEDDRPGNDLTRCLLKMSSDTQLNISHFSVSSRLKRYQSWPDFGKQGSFRTTKIPPRKFDFLAVPDT